MTKKDYQAIARAIYQTHQHDATNDDYREGWHAALTSVRMRLADVLSADNPRFDRARFIEACETGKTKGMRQA